MSQPLHCFCIRFTSTAHFSHTLLMWVYYPSLVLFIIMVVIMANNTIINKKQKPQDDGHTQMLYNYSVHYIWVKSWVVRPDRKLWIVCQLSGYFLCINLHWQVRALVVGKWAVETWKPCLHEWRPCWPHCQWALFHLLEHELLRSSLHNSIWNGYTLV